MITEVNQRTGYVELHNRSQTDTIDISDWYLVDYPFASHIMTDPFITIVSGELNMIPNSYVVLQWIAVNLNDGEIALYATDDYQNPESIQDYMQYNSGNHWAASVAVQGGVWDDVTAFVPNAQDVIGSLTMSNGTAQSALETGSIDWAEESPTPGNSNYEEPSSACDEVYTYNDPLLESLYIQAQRIIADGIVSSKEFETTFTAEAIELLENFEVEKGAILEIFVASCL